MFWPFPTQRTTPGQFLVFLGGVAVVLLVVGAILVYLSWGQPPEKAELAMEARSWGMKAVAGSVLLGALTWLGRRFIS